MPLPGPPNCLVDIYRTFNVASPIPPDGSVAAAYNVPAIIKQHMKLGRFGFSDNGLHWTHLLCVDSSVDIRSGYSSQLNAVDVAGSDTILLANCPSGSRCCPFYVVLVQTVSRRQAHFKKVYLDRLLPGTKCTGRDAPGFPVNCGGCASVPRTWLVTFPALTNATCSFCSQYGKQYTLSYHSGCIWDNPGENIPCASPGTNPVQLFYNQPDDTWYLTIAGATGQFVLYTLPSARFRCTQANTLPRTRDDGFCGGFPDTILIQPR